mgnify:CR=1 FL=1
MKQIKQLLAGRRKNMYILAILFILCLATELLLANWRDFSIKDAPVTVLPSETLASAKGATLLPDGTIQIDSVENQGTTIHVVIPFEIAEEPAVVQEMSELPKENLSGCRILLAEDNELNREIAAFLLKDEGISVTEAEDGQQAVECFLKMPEGYYDAVLIDIMMPVMDGYQAARAIRGSGKKDAEMIPIIAITANAFAEDKRKTMEAGMDAHLSKPLNVQELMDTIRKFCAGKQICQ